MEFYGEVADAWWNKFGLGNTDIVNPVNFS